MEEGRKLEFDLFRFDLSGTLHPKVQILALENGGNSVFTALEIMYFF